MATKRTKESAWKIVVVVSGCMFLIGFLCGLGLEGYYLSTLSPFADPSTGAIYPLEWHSSRVYLTSQQQLRTQIPFWVSLGFLTISIVGKAIILRNRPRTLEDLVAGARRRRL